MKCRTLIDAKPEHYGKWVVVKSFTDNTVVSYGYDVDHIIAHKDGLMLYCPAPCESSLGTTQVISMEMFDDGNCVRCPECKYKKLDRSK